MSRVSLASLTNPTQRMIYMVAYYTNIYKFNSEAKIIDTSSVGTRFV